MAYISANRRIQSPFVCIHACSFSSQIRERKAEGVAGGRDAVEFSDRAVQATATISRVQQFSDSR